MHADVLMKFLLTAGCVWGVLALAKRCGERVAGWAAGLPIASVPTLVLLGLDHGDAFVARAATGALLAVVSSAAFAVAYFTIAARARRWSRSVSLLGGALAIAAACLTLGALTDVGMLNTAAALALAGLACGCAGRHVRAPVATAPAAAVAEHSLVLTATLVATISTALAALSAELSAVSCGMLAGVPTTCAVMLIRQHRVNGADGVARLLEGYVDGLGLRVAFMAAVACAVVTGWAVSMLLGIGLCVVWSAIRAWPRRLSPPLARALVAMLAATATASAWPEPAPLWATVPNVPALPEAQQSGHVDHAGARLYYAAFNRDGGAPVILLHGGFASSAAWGFEVPLLAASHEVIVMDTRGHGRSSMPPTPLGYAEMADDVVAVLDALRIPKASVVGMSDGGIVGLILGSRYPARVDKLFLWGASFSTDADNPAPPDPSMSGMGASFMAAMALQYRAVSATPEGFAALRAALVELGRREPDLAAEQLASIRAPTVIADGDHEQFIDPVHTRRLATLVPGARLLILHGVSHGGPQQDPVGFHAAVAAWLGDDSPGKSLNPSRSNQP